ncbi:MAG: T9SS type A sorting domain-containing protein, partial [Bacteroidota bacterium]
GTANVVSLGTTVKLYQDLGVNANIYPNPASSILHVLAKFNSTRERVSLELFNSLGQEKYTCEVKNVSLLNEQLDVSKLSPGIYFLMIQSGDIAISKKIVVK